MGPQKAEHDLKNGKVTARRRHFRNKRQEHPLRHEVELARLSFRAKKRRCIKNKGDMTDRQFTDFLLTTTPQGARVLAAERAVVTAMKKSSGEVENLKNEELLHPVAIAEWNDYIAGLKAVNKEGNEQFTDTEGTLDAEYFEATVAKAFPDLQDRYDSESDQESSEQDETEIRLKGGFVQLAPDDAPDMEEEDKAANAALLARLDVLLSIADSSEAMKTMSEVENVIRDREKAKKIVDENGRGEYDDGF